MTALMDVRIFPQLSPGSYGTKRPQLEEFTISPFFHLQFIRNGYGLIQLKLN